MVRKGIRVSLHWHYLGPHPLIDNYLNRMNFRAIIRDCLGGGLARSLDHAEVLGTLVHNIIDGVPGVQAGSNAIKIPTLSQWGVMVLVLLLLILMLQMSRRKKQSQR